MHKSPSSYSYSLLLQFMLSKALYLHRLSVEDSVGFSSQTYIYPSVSLSRTWLPSSIWDMGISCTRKLHFYYSLLLEGHSNCPFSLTVGNSLYNLQLVLTEFSPTDKNSLLLRESLTHLVDALLACCHHCDHDATLLLFLWCKHAQIDAVLGFGKVANFLIQRFTSNLCQQASDEKDTKEDASYPDLPLQRAHHYLKTSYFKKGYFHLLPLIEENFVAMQQWNA